MAKVQTMAQIKRIREAKAAGDLDLVAQIRAENFGEDSTVIDTVVVDKPVAVDDEDIIDSLAAGLSNKEIAAKYTISVQKVAAVKRKVA